MCPGYFTAMPQTVEAAQACDAYRRGQLHVVFPGNENTIVVAAQELSAAYNRYEAETLRTER